MNRESRTLNLSTACRYDDFVTSAQLCRGPLKTSLFFHNVVQRNFSYEVINVSLY